MSPLLSNIYLDALYWQMVRNRCEMVRYADDFILLCGSSVTSPKALEQVRLCVEENALTLHPIKTRLCVENGRRG